MELSRQEGRGRPSRSRKDVSNKENICPSQSADSIAAEAARRCSPLPEGFPRSPLQDITHIIYPHNVCPADEDMPTDQVCKKFRKDNSAGNCIENESDRTIQQESAQQHHNPSWKGLAPCVHVKHGTKLLQTAVTTKESMQSADVEVVAKISSKARLKKLVSDLCIYRDSVPTDAISLPHCIIEGGEDAKSEEQIKQTGALNTQAHLIQHGKISAVGNRNNLKQRVGNRSMQTLVGKENHIKRLQQSAQSKKKGNLSLLR